MINISRYRLEDMIGFYLVDLQPNVLCGWISGKNARQMELLDEATVQADCVWLIKKFLGKKMQVTEPVKMLRTKWFSNKYSRGQFWQSLLKNKRLQTNDFRKLLLPQHQNRPNENWCCRFGASIVQRHGKGNRAICWRSDSRALLFYRAWRN